MNDQTKNLMNMFLGWSFPARIAASAMFSAIGSLGVGFLSEYAAYSYALAWSIRPPFEGIPYLAPTVSALTFSLIVIALSVFSVVYAFLRLSAPLEKVVRVAETGLPPPPEERGSFVSAKILRRVPPRFVSIVYGAPMELIRDAYSLSDDYEFALGIIRAFGRSWVFNPAAQIWAGFVVTLSVVVLLCAALFVPSNYGALLRLMDYGGGVPVTLHIKGGPPRTDRMLLRSTTAVTLQGSSGSSEYPLANILSIDYLDEKAFENLKNVGKNTRGGKKAEKVTHQKRHKSLIYM